MLNIKRAIAAATICGALAILPTSSALAEGYSTPDTGISVETPKLVPGEAFTVSAGGYAPFSTVEVFLYSDPGFLGTLTADSTGRISGEFNIPAGITVGSHILEMRGFDAEGDPLVLTLGVFLEAPSAPTASAVTGTLLLPLLLLGGGTAGAGAVAIRFGRRRAGT